MSIERHIVRLEAADLGREVDWAMATVVADLGSEAVKVKVEAVKVKGEALDSSGL